MRHLLALAAAAARAQDTDHSCVEALHLGVRRYHLWRPRAHGVCSQAPVVVESNSRLRRHAAKSLGAHGEASPGPGLGGASPTGTTRARRRPRAGDARKQNLDDVGFLQKLVEDVRDRTGAERVFGAGFSNAWGYMVSKRPTCSTAFRRGAAIKRT